MPSSTKRVSRAALAITLLGTVLGCDHSPPRTEAQKANDKEIEARVDSALQADQLLFAKHINVHAYNGVVRLSGYVWEPPDITEAQSVAQGVTGVTGVVNELELQRNGLGNSPVSR